MKAIIGVCKEDNTHDVDEAYGKGTYARLFPDEDDCTCEAPLAGPTDIDPSEVKLNRNCPMHGIDPDEARDRKSDI